MTQHVIALDGDGVLLDYNVAYARTWHKVFGVHPAERDPNAYWAMDRWVVERLEGERLARFRAGFDHAFWASMPALDRALEACFALHDSGYTLVCVSALQPQFERARLRNLRELGFPIEKVVATGNKISGGSPKAAAIANLRPLAMVDDYLPNLAGLGPNVHTALIIRQPDGSPNVGPELAAVGSSHIHLGDFAKWWLDLHR